MTAAGFVGANPAGLRNLARLSHDCSIQVLGVGATVKGLVPRHSEASAAETVRMLRAVAEALAEAAHSLEWRAAVIERARDAADGCSVVHHHYDLACFAAGALFDQVDSRKSFGDSVEPPNIAAFANAPPAQVAAAFSRLTPSVATELADRYPGIVGRLDGAPPGLRYRASRILLRRRIVELDLELSRLAELEPVSWVDWIDPRWLTAVFPLRATAEGSGDRLRSQLAEYRRWLAEERQILLFDPDGDGLVVEVFGNLENADRVAVVVPGITNDKANFGAAGDGGFRTKAADLYEAAATVDPSVATIAWLGYDTPDGIDAGLRDAAESGAPALRRFIEGIDTQAQSKTTVIGHSYGSLVAGLAAADGLAVDDLVFIGSPGTGLDHAEEARLKPGGRVWVGLATDDPIGTALAPTELSRWWVPLPVPPYVMPLMPARMVAGTSDGPETLWHGANPAADAFGATRFGTRGCSGHSGYFEAGSLQNLVKIVQGRYGDVDLAE